MDDGEVYELDTAMPRDEFAERVRDYLVGQYGDAADGVEFRLDDGSRWRVLAERGFNGTSWVEEG
jgi:hypothetical protein